MSTHIHSLAAHVITFLPIFCHALSVQQQPGEVQQNVANELVAGFSAAASAYAPAVGISPSCSCENMCHAREVPRPIDIVFFKLVVDNFLI